MLFKKGCTPWNKGKVGVYSPELILSKSIAWKGKPSRFKGKRHSPQAIEKLRLAAFNHPNRKGPKGKPWSLKRIEAQKKRNGAPYDRKPHNKKPHNRKPLLKDGVEYAFNWHEIRKIIYKRDKWVCMECDVHCNGDYKNKIQCHHIDYNPANNDLSNLVTLCASCHAKTNYGREDWTKHYKKIIGVRG